MNKVWRVGLLAAAALVALVAACNYIPTAPAPTPVAPSTSATTISGPDSIAPGQSAQYFVSMRLSDGTVKSSSPQTPARWFVADTSVLQVDANGLVTALQKAGETIVNAVITSGSRSTFLSKDVLVLPNGTFRLAGTVTESGSDVAVPNAQVSVSPGGLSTTTDLNGNYKLYGVPADFNVQVTLNGYQPASALLHLTTQGTQNFQLTASGPPVSISGNYSVAIDVVGGCSTSQLSTDLQHRTYDAVVTQTAQIVTVQLTESRFRVNGIGRGNQFTGRANAAGVTFTLNDFSSYYYPFYGPTTYPSVAEAISDGTFLVPAGTIPTSGSAAGLSGVVAADGDLTHWRLFPFNAQAQGSCSGTSIFSLTLTPR